MNWPRPRVKGIWTTVNLDLTSALEGLRGTVEKKLQEMGDLIYDYGAKRFGVCERRKKVALEVVKSRQQQEIDRLVRERSQLIRQWRKAPELTQI